MDINQIKSMMDVQIESAIAFYRSLQSRGGESTYSAMMSAAASNIGEAERARFLAYAPGSALLEGKVLWKGVKYAPLSPEAGLREVQSSLALANASMYQVDQNLKATAQRADTSAFPQSSQDILALLTLTDKKGVREEEEDFIDKTVSAITSAPSQILQDIGWIPKDTVMANRTIEEQRAAGEIGGTEEEYQAEQSRTLSEVQNKSPQNQANTLSQPTPLRNTPVTASSFSEAMKIAESILGPFAKAEAQALAEKILLAGQVGEPVYLPPLMAKTVQESRFNLGYWLVGVGLFLGLGYVVYKTAKRGRSSSFGSATAVPYEVLPPAKSFPLARKA